MTLYSLITGFILDLLIGDPLWLPHPIRFIGRLISVGERVLRKISCKTNPSQFLCGMILTFCVAGISFVIPFLLLDWAYGINTMLGFVFEALMCYQILATKSLKTESMKVYMELQKGNLPEARKRLSWIVSRDTANLSTAQVTKGAVETVAENISDGVIAPMTFILIGGAPLGFLYKAINTLDSMTGYKNDQYLYFGKFAARLDDIVNYIPARISAYLMILAVFFTGYDLKGALRIYRRDRHNHTSPNSAHAEAVCAGALHIQLAGNNYYFGKLVEKPTIGDDTRPIEAEDIKRANKLLYATSFLGLVLGSGIRLLMYNLTR
ncbi:MAG: cobalamin biosynthesis protein CobD [Peptococcaceae bacterium]|nr:cobalamin biosynthesis protein CobD [Peptococcaceae bacterium]